jgi:hypothetical protein
MRSLPCPVWFNLKIVTQSPTHAEGQGFRRRTVPRTGSSSRSESDRMRAPEDGLDLQTGVVRVRSARRSGTGTGDSLRSGVESQHSVRSKVYRTAGHGARNKSVGRLSTARCATVSVVCRTRPATRSGCRPSSPSTSVDRRMRQLHRVGPESRVAAAIVIPSRQPVSACIRLETA